MIEYYFALVMITQARVGAPNVEVLSYILTFEECDKMQAYNNKNYTLGASEGIVLYTCIPVKEKKKYGEG